MKWKVEGNEIDLDSMKADLIASGLRGEFKLRKAAGKKGFLPVAEIVI